MADLIINFEDLPKDVLSKIPLSIRTSGNTHHIIDLPTEVQYLIKKYLDLSRPDITYESTLDTKPEVSIYSDLEIINDTKQLIIHYLQNYLLVSVGSYPFDVEFGSKLKQQLQTRDTALRNTLIGNEIGLVAGVLGDDYNMNVKITNVSTKRIESSTHTEFKAEITASIDDEKFLITV